MTRDPDFQADLDRYPPNAFLREQSIWAIWIYRHGRRILRRPDGLRKKLELKAYWQVFRVIETLTGICLPIECEIGPGLRIHHFGNIILNPATRMGSNVTLRHGVTLGNRHNEEDAPTIGDDVEFGAYAQVLGPITVGDGAKIGAMSVVLEDVPAGATAVGNPARVLSSAS